MTIDIQIKLLIFSFIFCFIFFLVSIYNLNLIKNFSKLKQFIINLVFVIDFVFIYLIILYKISFGNFHLYFAIMIICGYLIGYKMRQDNVKFNLKWLKRIVKTK